MKKETPEMKPRTIVNIPVEIKMLIRDFRFENRLDTEADAIRELLVRGLKASGVEVELGEDDKP